MAFKDYFSAQSVDYARFRPDYPGELFAFIAGAAPNKASVWDCGTGNGQAALALAEHFDSVYATDPSSLQIEAARPRDGVTYSIAPAEESGLPDASVDCVTVAQALHWFDFDAFYAEVRRVCRPGGLLAAWGYSLNTVIPAVDEIFYRFYEDIVGEYWPPERKYIENGYRDIPFPFAPVEHPELKLEKEWNLYEFAGYLSTWSAVSRFRMERESDPLDLIEKDLTAAWGDPETRRTVRWPLHLLAGRVE